MRAGIALPVSLALAMALLTLAWGDAGLAPADILAALRGDPVAGVVVGTLRGPRVAVAILVGACLAVAGTITQAVMRNPLAEPGLLGINGGAGLGVTILIVHLTGPTGHLMPLAGFAGATLAAAAIYGLAWRQGTSAIRLILVGIGIGALTGAAISFLTAFGDVRDVQRAVGWMAGSLYGADWARFSWLLAWSVPALVATRLLARELDILGFDDDCIQSLGLRLHLMRGILILLCTVLAGASVAAAGPLAFIGLLAPHLARICGDSRHAYRLPMAATWGAILLLAADLGGRLLNLPAGVLTPLIGVPFIGILLWKQRDD